jgi:hypothetical protein
LPDNFADEYQKTFGVAPSPEVITHCRRELCHAIITLILKGEFAEAYKNGIIIEFPDGVVWWIFPCFYCYIAKYPEKYLTFYWAGRNHLPSLLCRVLIATIKNMGQYPCPCCFIKLAEVADLGKDIDWQQRQDIQRPTPQLFHMVWRAHKSIFEGGIRSLAPGWRSR